MQSLVRKTNECRVDSLKEVSQAKNFNNRRADECMYRSRRLHTLNLYQHKHHTLRKYLRSQGGKP